MEKEKKDLQTKDCSLSIDSWMTVLSSEINRNEGLLSHILSTCLILTSIIIAILVGYFTFLMDLLTVLENMEFAPSNLPALIEGARLFINTMWVVWFFLIISAGFCVRVTQKRINALERIRNDAIFRNSDLKEICKRWKQYRKASVSAI